jgi:ribonuclease P/MRP protein subunit POP5
MPQMIPSTLRERNRYIAFEIVSDSPVSRGEVVKAVWGTLLRFLGELGASKTALWVMDWDEEKQHGILKVNHGSLDEARAALVLMKEANGRPIVFRTLGVSGTVKKTKEKFLSA